MLGAVIGDIIGSRYEGKRHPKTSRFLLFNKNSRFTDDTVLTCAVADVLMNGGSFEDKIREYYRRYPKVGYGSAFKEWGNSDDMDAYNSYGNGSAMRVSPIGFFASSESMTMKLAEESAEVTHNHPEGIKGAQAIAAATYLAWQGQSKKDIKDVVEGMGYRTDIILTSEHLGFDCTCQETVPQAIDAFLHSNDFESTIRAAIMMGGDSDTIAAMAGGIAHAFYNEIPQDIVDEALKRLPNDLAEILDQFMIEYVDEGFRSEMQNKTKEVDRGIIF
jgi:ADP-ribosylglycohydrolase